MKLKRNRQLLFTPGPVNIASNVKQASIHTDIGHREVEFEQLLSRLRRNTLKALSIKSTKQYDAVFVTGSGTAGNETILSSLGDNKKILVLTNGEFGERVLAIAQLHNKHVKQINFGWGQEIDTGVVRSYLKAHKVDIVAMVHHETSSGMINPVKAVGDIAHEFGLQFIVDAVSSATADALNIEDSHITFLNTSSGKAIGSFPGLAIIVGKKESFESLSSNQTKIAYLNLYKFYHYSITYNQTPNTPGVQLFCALDQAIKNILKEGVNERKKKIAYLANYMRKNMQELGLNMLLQTNMSSVVTSVYLPLGISFKKLQEEFRRKNIIIYNGKGPFKDRIFQVGHIGELTIKDADYFNSCLKKIIVNHEKSKIERRKHTHHAPLSLGTFVARIPHMLVALFAI